MALLAATSLLPAAEPRSSRTVDPEEEKKALLQRDLDFIIIPVYPEISVKRVLELVKGNPRIL